MIRLNGYDVAGLQALRDQINERLAQLLHPEGIQRAEEPDSPDFGRHLIIDGWACWDDEDTQALVESLLNDSDYLTETLDRMVEMVGMTVLRPASMVTVPLDPEQVDTGEDAGGVTGVVILTTSHGSLHTWPLRGQISFDLFSCKDFDAEALMEFAIKAFRLTGGHIRSFTRKHKSAFRQSFELIP